MNCLSSHHALPLVLLQPAYLQQLVGSCLHKSSLKALVLPLSKVKSCTISSLTGPLQHLTIAINYTLLSIHCLVQLQMNHCGLLQIHLTFVQMPQKVYRLHSLRWTPRVRWKRDAERDKKLTDSAGS